MYFPSPRSVRVFDKTLIKVFDKTSAGYRLVKQCLMRANLVKECSSVFQNGSFSFCTAGSMMGLFLDIYCKNLVELAVRGKTHKSVGYPDLTVSFWNS